MFIILVIAATVALAAGVLLGAGLQSIKEKSGKELNAYQAFIGTVYSDLAYAAARVVVETGVYSFDEVKRWRYTTRLFRYWVKKYPSLLRTIDAFHSKISKRVNVRFNLDKDIEGQLIVLMEVIPWLLFEVDVNGEKVGKPLEFWRSDQALKCGGSQMNAKLWAGFLIINPWGNRAV